jgi:hypothetical protein
MWRIVIMRAPSIRTRRIFTRSSAPVAVLLAGLMVWQGSNAAFSADTRNIGNSWETGSVAISDDDGGAAMFQIQDVIPGQTGNKCIAVTATPSVASTIKFYVGDLATDGLEPYVKVTVAQGTGGSFSSCTDFTADQTEASQSLAAIQADHSNWATGILPWTAPAGSTVKTYKITWVFDTTGLTQPQIDALQGKASSINFEWELQNNA